MARSPNIDLSSLSVKDLKDLRSKVDEAIADREKTERIELKARMAALAADAGFSLEDLIGGRRGKAGKGTIKYRNPENPEETWTGRGRKPNWLNEKLGKRGAKLEDFAI